jgi:hypothetical protein
MSGYWMVVGNRGGALVMNDVIGEILPLAIGVAISPVPIIAVILMLLAHRAGATAAGFLVGWVAGIVVVATVVTIVAAGSGLSEGGGGSRGFKSTRPSRTRTRPRSILSRCSTPTRLT